MPVTKIGKEVMKYLKKKHGPAKGLQIFYASINKGIKGSDAWHKEKESQKAKKSKYSEALI